MCCWATGALPEPTATLLFFLCAVVLHIAPAPVVFSGFTSTAWWLMFGGAVTGVALRGTGLALRLADIIFHKRVNTYPQVIATVAMSAVGLAFLMPSTTGRVLLLMPIVLALSDRLGFRPGSNGRIGMVLTVAAASYMPPTSILPANIPNSVLLGAANSLYGINLSYGSYLLLHFPVLGALKTVVLVWLVCKLFPETAAMTPQPPAARTAMSKPETLLAVLLGLAVAAFATDAWHGISPAWISLAACIVCLLPGIGLVSPKALTEQVHLVPLLYVAGFLGLGAVVEHTGLGTAISAALLHWLPLAPGHTAGNVGALGAMGAVLRADVDAARASRRDDAAGARPGHRHRPAAGNRADVAGAGVLDGVLPLPVAAHRHRHAAGRRGPAARHAAVPGAGGHHGAWCCCRWTTSGGACWATCPDRRPPVGFG